jgi:UDP-N-acetylmuramoyl-tripeptide--D-alanyl-D-alanine ligase
MTKEAVALTLHDLIVALGGRGGDFRLPADTEQRQIVDAVIDSRLATPGCLFVALRGERLDGHDFILEAVDKGAVAVFAERPPHGAEYVAGDAQSLQIWTLLPRRDVAGTTCLVVPDSLAALQQVAAHWRRQHAARVIGITGSVGKTVTKELAAAVLRQRYSTLKSEGNYNNEIGLPLTLLQLTAAHARVVLEMGMYETGEITQLARIASPQVGLVTNVGPTHLERLGSIERIAQAKAELPQALPAAEQGGIAILNMDDLYCRNMASMTQARVFFYGLDANADLWANDIESRGLEGIHFQLHRGRETIHTRIPMLGRHSVHTALCAASVGLVEGLSWEEIIAGLRDQTAQLRLVAVPGPDGSVILDDTYNASPTSSIAALALLDELEGRKIAVLGDMYELGNYEKEAHELVGRKACEVSDVLITVGQLGRIIGEEALKAGMDPSTVYLLETKAQAIDLLNELTAKGGHNDRVLVKGSRGLEMEEIVTALTQYVRQTGPKARGGRS